jgi:opacity protein-like surface antigen
MKINKILIVFVFLFAFSATTNAQTSNKNFDGFSIEVGFANQMQSNDSKYDNTSEFPSTLSFEHYGESNSIPRVALNYDFQPFSRFAIGFGGSYMFGESKDNSIDTNSSMTISNATSFYVAPTFLVSDTTGVYGKISFNAAKGKYNDVFATPSAANDDKFITGFGYGFGVKSFITKNFYLLAEVERVNYGRENYKMDDDESYSVDTETTNATISLGVKF